MTQTDVDTFIDEERDADDREAYGDWLYEVEREEREQLDRPVRRSPPPRLPCGCPLDSGCDSYHGSQR